MSQARESFNQLLTEISHYVDHQRDLYGDEIYTACDFTGLTLTPSHSKEQRLLNFYEQIKFCQKCDLSQSRRQVVFGAGNPSADIIIIGEAPGRDEDIQGKPFVGAAGQLLTKILAAIQLTREEVYITNINKCRPPQNRDPLPDEQEACKPYLFQQIEIIEPKFILALGRIAGQSLLNTTATMKELRGKVHHFKNIKLIVTYHPAALLRNPQWKRETWEDVQLLQKLYQRKDG